jgi:ferritin-like metal-binding protein YciE
MKLRSLEDLMVAQLKTLRGAEEQIVNVLPKYAKSASSSEAIAGLQAQVTESMDQRARLSQIADELGRKLSPRGCDPVTGMLEEMRILTSSKKTDPLTLDVALLSSAQRLLRHRMNAYRHARTLAEEKGSGRTVELLNEALAEQAEADLELNKQLLALIKPPVASMVAKLAEKAVKPRRPRKPAAVVDRMLGVETAEAKAGEKKAEIAGAGATESTPPSAS